MYYEEVFRALNKARVDYTVVGGVALVLHDVVRLTVDLDIMVDLSDVNLKKLVSAIRNLGYRPKVPVDLDDLMSAEKRRRWVKEKNMRVFSVYNPKKPFMMVDILMENPVSYAEVRKSSITVKIRDIEIPVVSKKHLKRLKRISGRKQDLEDIKALNRLEGMDDGKKKI